MRIGPLGLPELLILMVIILLIFGAKRIPEISRSMGSGLRLFKKGLIEDEETEPPKLS